jgi:hypothetical protein
MDFEEYEEALGDDWLDDIVHSLKSAEASAINNLGLVEQIAYVVESLGPEEAKKAFDEIIEQVKRP